jgi:uncharacterized protein YdiU (UPF0061 family)
MALKALKATKDAKESSNYSQFDQLDGSHPLKEFIPDSAVLYRVRSLREGEVLYFNFNLAKEMGLIPQDHPEQLNPELERKILETFCVQIINEYDLKTQKKFDPSTIKKNQYMASRYLQLQHRDKTGRTSGDGRGIWNGVFKSKSKVWDVSSRGTGVTCLAPGSAEANRPLQTGGDEFSYGCGQAEIDELIAAAILAEIVHLQGVNTERVLCVIDVGKGFGIGVRAALNLLRPAHAFLYLKQNKRHQLKSVMDYFIQRQKFNGQSQKPNQSLQVYEQLLDELSESFARFVAQLDVEYIFAWLDWDGDNVLMNAGIIDYGSVRQFGIRHDKYRYDDVDRFSTNLNQQKVKARQLIQTFAQIADYIKTGKKKSLKKFVKHEAVLKFEKSFKKHRADRILYKMGLNQTQRENVFKKSLFNIFDKEFVFLERAKVKGKIKKVADGINHPALFNLKAIFRELPKHFETTNSLMPPEQFFKLILSSFAKNNDSKLNRKIKKRIRAFQISYLQILQAASGKQKINLILRGIAQRSSQLNREERITGNALIQIVDEILEERKKGLKNIEVQKIIEQLIHNYIGLPEVNSKSYKMKPRSVVRADFYSKLLNLVTEFSHDI